MALIGCKDLGIAFGGAALLQQAELQIERGEKIGLLGRNGEGKSTLLKLLAKDLEPDTGTLVYASGVKVSRLTQEVPAQIDLPVGTVIRNGAEDPVADHVVQRLCSQFELEPDQAFTALSGGQKRKALLARALVKDPDVLLLDEPTNHLDLDGIRSLETFLERFAGALVFVTHDRTFLQKLAIRIVELDRGCLRSWDCDYPTFLSRKAAFLLAEEARWAQLDKKLAKEEDWVRQGIKARRTRDAGRVRALQQLRAERAQRREQIGTVKLNIPSAGRSGTKVIKARQIEFRYDSAPASAGEAAPGPPLISDFTTEITRGDRIGIIGPNGCGKTTLLHLLLGKLEPQGGTVKHGTRLEVAYFDQHRQQLNPDKTVIENISDGRDRVVINGQARHVIGYLGDFLFSPDRARQPVSVLSGGERNRLLLARLFTQPSNVLVLDEPSNDLDTETLELLELRLLEYPGTVLLASHDRSFLDNVVSSAIVFEAPGVVREYAGGYTDWQKTLAAQSATHEQSPPEAPSPKRARTNTSAVKKLSNKERDEWKGLPAEIDALEAELSELGKAMLASAFYRGDPARVKACTERAANLPVQIEEAFTRWAELDARS